MRWDVCWCCLYCCVLSAQVCWFLLLDASCIWHCRECPTHIDVMKQQAASSWNGSVYIMPPKGGVCIFMLCLTYGCTKSLLHTPLRHFLPVFYRCCLSVTSSAPWHHGNMCSVSIGNRSPHLQWIGEHCGHCRLCDFTK